MKRGLFCLVFSFLVLLQSAAQAGKQMPTPPAAIYLHSEDFLAAENAEARNDWTASCRSQMHLAVRSRWIVSKTGNTRQIFSKDSIFGYRLRNGLSYRWDKSQRKAFEIVDHGPIVIYRSYEAQYGVKDPLPKAVFYFSMNLDAPILALNCLNLKRAFPMNFRLHHHLDLLPRAEMVAQRAGENGPFYIQTVLKTLLNGSGSTF